MSGEVLHLLLYEGSGILFVTTLAVTAVARPPLGKWSEIAQLLPYLCVCDRRATERERESKGEISYARGGDRKRQSKRDTSGVAGKDRKRERER